MKSFYFFIGTTAELIKVAPVIKEFKSRRTNVKVIATGQNNIIFEDTKQYLGNIKPDILFEDKNKKSSLLGFGIWTVKTFFSCVYRLKKEFSYLNKDETYLIVHGDTVSSVLGAFIAKIYRIKLVHIESGLRSFNFFEPFPEEISRYITSSLSDIKFCPNMWAVKNFKRKNGSIVSTKENTLYDTYKISLKDKTLPPVLKKIHGKYYVLVIHRQEHVIFGKRKMQKTLETVLKNSDKNMKVVFMMLALTDNFVKSLPKNLLKIIKSQAILSPRLPYAQFIRLLERSEFVVTDGGSNQEELYYMGKPCLLLRNVTERIEGLGKNVVLSKESETTISDFFKNYKKYTRVKYQSKISPSKIIVDYLLKKT